MLIAPEVGTPQVRALSGRYVFRGDFTPQQDSMAKNQNTFEKRRREVEKKRKADEKRDRRRQKQDPAVNQVSSDQPAEEASGPRSDSDSSTTGGE